ncbi:SusC/RagA family TonB-linked outer membrane protein [Spirosoma jeollabukense]
MKHHFTRVLKRHYVLIHVLWLLAATTSWAQTNARTVTGKILSKTDGKGLPGANVLVKGTSVGAVTDAEGSFSINAQPNATLTASYIGFVSQEIAIGNQTELTISLTEDASQLNEVVVTALGIARDKKALGYSLQELKGSEITQARSTNLVNALSGKIAGVQVTATNGLPGASSRILIRGANSIGGNNQPLFVVDGIPIDNGSYNVTPGSTGGNVNNTTTDYGNGASAINPDDIDNISVLKGANAAALYGSRAANGVILITTKRGSTSKNIGVTVNTNTTFENPLRLPDFQNEYGQGLKGQFSYVDGMGGGVNDGVDESWGPKLDGRLIPQFNSPIGADGKRTATPWIARPDNVKNFYDTGVTTSNSIALTGGSDKGDFRLGYTNLYQKGMLPNTNYKRQNITLNAGWNFTPKFNIRTSINYVKDGSDNRQNLNLYWIWFGRQVDLDDLKANPVETGTDPSQWPVQRNWNSNYWNNPAYALKYLKYANDKDRVIGNITATYKLTDWLTLTGRTGTDFSNDRRITKQAKNVGVPNGSYAEDIVFVRETNSDFLLTADKRLSDLHVVASVGGNARQNYTQRDYMYASELTIPNLYNIGNAKSRPTVINRITDKRVNSLYGSASLSFRDYLFVDVTARNDWSSTLPAGNRSYFYPSVSASAIVTDMFGLSSNVLTYAKVRGGYAKVGNDTDPYNLTQVFSNEIAWGNTTTFSENNLIYNKNLKPEITTAIEFGVETRLFNNALSFEFTYYDKNTKNQILQANVAQSSGYYNSVINAGQIRNSGFEVELSGAPIKRPGGFRWDVGFNFARNRSEVIDLGGLSTYQINTGSLLRNVILEARPGDPYGNFFGTYYRRDPSGNMIFNSQGYPIMSSDRKVVGNIMPKWTGGFQNTFTYKWVSLSSLIDVRYGGNVFSQGINIGRYTGVLAETLPGREGNIVGQGVVETANADGTFSYAPNTTVVASADDYYHNYYNRNVNEAYIFDASYVKLREVKLGFSFPQKWFGRTPFRTVTFALVGRNLALLYKNLPHIDPETSYYGDGNVQGFENGNTPSARSMGFNLNFGL